MRVFLVLHECTLAAIDDSSIIGAFLRVNRDEIVELVEKSISPATPKRKLVFGVDGVLRGIISK